MIALILLRKTYGVSPNTLEIPKAMIVRMRLIYLQQPQVG